MSIEYLQVAEDVGEEPIKLPTEDDSTLLLSTLASQFPGACGLKYRNPESRFMRGVRFSEGRLHPPPEVGWGSQIFYCVVPRGLNRIAAKKWQAFVAAKEEAKAKRPRVNIQRRKLARLAALGGNKSPVPVSLPATPNLQNESPSIRTKSPLVFETPSTPISPSLDEPMNQKCADILDSNISKKVLKKSVYSVHEGDGKDTTNKAEINEQVNMVHDGIFVVPDKPVGNSSAQIYAVTTYGDARNCQSDMSYLIQD